MIRIVLTIFLISLISCETLFIDQTIEKTFIIRAGKHESDHGFRGFEGDTLNFIAKFSGSAIYASSDPANQADLNKLLGFSNCNTHHLQNSARIGWRWYNDRLEIFAYVRDNGRLIFQYITSVPLDTLISYSIQMNESGYLFIVNGTEKYIKTSSSCKGTNNYILWPYFGGDEPAPHDIEIYLEIK